MLVKRKKDSHELMREKIVRIEKIYRVRLIISSSNSSRFTRITKYNVIDD